MKKFLLIFFCFFGILITNANAKSAICIYGTGTNSVKFSIDDNYKMNFSAVNELPYTSYKHSASIDDFISPYDSNNFYCPEIIYYKVVSSGNSGIYYFSFNNSNDYKNSMSISDSKIDNTQSTDSAEDNEKEILATCKYGDGTGYSITYFNDGSSIGSGLGSNSGNNVRFNENYNYDNKCPNNIYVSEGGGYATIYYSSQGNAAKTYTINTGSNSEGNEETSKLDVEEIVFCERNETRKTFQIIGYVLFFAKIIVPLLLIILGSIDFAKAVISNSDKAPQDALKAFGIRIIIAVIIFLIPTILSFLIGLIDGASEAFEDTSFSDCSDCLLDPFGDCQAQDIVK